MLANELDNAVEDQSYYSRTIASAEMTGKLAWLGQAELAGRMDFLRVVALQTARQISADRLTSEFMPDIISLDVQADDIEEDIRRVPNYDPLRREQFFTWRTLLPQIVLFPALTTYPPDDREAANFRKGHALAAGGKFRGLVANCLELYDSSASSGRPMGTIRGALSEVTLLSLLNLYCDGDRLALPGLLAQDNCRSTDLNVYSCDVASAVYKRVQSKSGILSGNDKRSVRDMGIALISGRHYGNTPHGVPLNRVVWDESLRIEGLPEYPVSRWMARDVSEETGEEYRMREAIGRAYQSVSDRIIRTAKPQLLRNFKEPLLHDIPTI